MILKKKFLAVSIAASLMSMSSGVCAATVKAQSADQAAAANNTQAQKMTMSIGEVNVNTRTGDVDFQAKLPGFGGLDVSVNYSNLFGYSTMQGNPSFLGMPRGVFLSGIPFVHKGNDGNLVLFYNGSDYYIDDKYASVNIVGKEVKSGIRYMASNMMYFHNYAETPTAIYIETASGKEEKIYYSYKLEYKNGTTYYFNKQGLCVAVTDAYFEDSAEANYKHITRISYDNPNNTPELAKISVITDAIGNQLHFVYDYQRGEISINYPRGSSDQSFNTTLAVSSQQLTAIRQGLNTQYDTGYKLYYTSAGQLASVLDTLFNKGTFTQPKDYYGNKEYQFNYTNDGKVSSRTVMDKSVHANSTQAMSQYYHYLGSSQNTFQYGADTSMDMPKIDMNQVQYVTEEQVGNQVIVHSYNFLHQEIITDAKYIDSSQQEHLISRTFNHYPTMIDTANGDRKLRTNYADPIKNVTVIYEKDKHGNDQSVSITQTVSTYNDFDQVTSKEVYPAVAFKSSSNGVLKANYALKSTMDTPEYPQGIHPITSEQTQYDEAHLLQPIVTKKIDYTTGETLETRKTLDGLYRQPVEETEYYGNLRTNAVVQGKTVKYQYASDTSPCLGGGNLFDASMKCKETIVYGNDAERSVSKLYAYDINFTEADKYPEITTTTIREATDKNLGAIPTVSSKEISVGGKTIESIDGTGLTMKMDYDVRGNLLQKQSGDGKVEKHIYDFVNRTQIEEITPSGTNGDDSLLNKKEVYDFMGNVVSSFDRNQQADGQKSTLETKRTIYDYSNGPRAIKQIDDYGNETRMTYDNRGEVVKKEDYHVVTGQNGTDLEKVSETTRDYAFVCDADYGCYQKVVETQDNASGNGLVSTSYVRGKRADKEDEPAVLYAKTILAKDGSIVKLEKSDYTETGILLGYHQFDNHSNLINEKTYHYDGKGRKDKEIMKSYAIGQNSATHEYELEHKYDEWNEDKEVATILTAPDQNGRFQGYTKYYDVVGRQVKTCYTLSGKEHCTQAAFDDADRQISGVDFNGNRMTQEYSDLTGDLIKQTYIDPHSNANDVITSAYNGFGMISESKQNGDGIGYHYNQIGLPLYLDYMQDGQKVLKGAHSEIKYDEHNQILEMNDYNGFTFVNHYLADGRVDRQEIHNSQGQVVGRIENSYYSYSDQNPQKRGKLKQSVAYFNDGKITNTQTTVYDYDLQGREVSKHYTDTQGSDTVITTAYDARNNIATISYVDHSSLHPDDANMNKVVNYEYDDLNRLVKSTTNISVPNGLWTKEVVTYAYDINGNILDEVDTTEGKDKTTVKSSHYVYNEIDQLLTKQERISENGQTISDTKLDYEYDLNGNLIKTTDQSTQKVIAEYRYNGQNQMVEFIDQKHGGLSYQYTYYPAGHRQSKTDGKQTVKFYYDTQGHILNEALLDQSGHAVKMSSLFGPFRYLQDK